MRQISLWFSTVSILRLGWIKWRKILKNIIENRIQKEKNVSSPLGKGCKGIKEDNGRLWEQRGLGEQREHTKGVMGKGDENKNVEIKKNKWFKED